MRREVEVGVGGEIGGVDFFLAAGLFLGAGWR